MARLSLKRRLILGIVCIMLPLLAVILVSYVAFNDLLSTLEQVSLETIGEVAPVADLEDLVEHAEWLLHDGLLHPENADMQLFAELVPIVEQAFDRSAQLSFGQQAERIGVRKSHELWNSAREKWQKLQQGGLSIAEREPLELEVLIAVRSAVVSLEQIRTIALTEVEDGRDEERRWRSTLNLFLPLVLIVGIGIAFTTANSLLRAIIDPVKELERGAQQLADGQLSYRVGELSHDELGDLARSFNLMAGKLEQTHQTLEGLSNLDFLTGLANVREFYRLFHEEIHRAERYQHPFSLIVLDVDTFKQVNDNFGHQIGDLVLQEVARKLSDLVRNSDHVARIGGDEFAIVLPETDSYHAAELAERIRSFFAEHRVEAEEQPELSLQITISLGLAVYPVDAERANELFAAADQALYQAKDRGRNQLCLAGGKERGQDSLDFG